MRALARWIWAGEWHERWRAQARTLISLNLSEPPSLFPCRPGFCDFVRGSRDEVPPHFDNIVFIPSPFVRLRDSGEFDRRAGIRSRRAASAQQCASNYKEKEFPYPTA